MWAPWLKWMPSLLMNTKVKVLSLKMITAELSTINMMFWGTQAAKFTFLMICILSISSCVRFSLWNVSVVHYNLFLIWFFCFIQDSVFMIPRNNVLHSSIYYDWDGTEALKTGKRLHAHKPPFLRKWSYLWTLKNLTVVLNIFIN